MISASPLPEGLKFYIWPNYRVEFLGAKVRITPTQAEILMLLLSKPGKLFSTNEITEAVYGHREDGGPDNGGNTIRKTILDLTIRLRDGGIDMKLKNPLSYFSYGLWSVALCEPRKVTLERLGVTFEDKHAQRKAEKERRKANREKRKLVNRGKPLTSVPGRKPDTAAGAVRRPYYDPRKFVRSDTSPDLPLGCFPTDAAVM